MSTKFTLSRRGFALQKKDFSPSKILKIKKELTVKPFVPTDYGAPPASFPVYIETTKKLYVPKYWGLNRFGKPDENRITPGKDIDIKFNGSLRDEQMHPVKLAMESFDKNG